MWTADGRAAARYRVLRYETAAMRTERPPPTRWISSPTTRGLLQPRISRTHWVGLSMGGMIGQTGTRASGLFASLSLCDTSSAFRPRPSRSGGPHQDRRDQGDGAAGRATGALADGPFRERRKDVADKWRRLIRSTPPRG